MKTLIPMDDYGVFVDKHDTARVDSRYVAQFFEKRHDHVLRDIAKITAPKSGLSDEFREMNFMLSSYMDSTGRKLRCYLMTRDGFTLLAMGYTGQKAMQFKELYIRRFNEMEAFIKTLVSARQEFPLLTENIRLLKENPKPYHFSNECDMLNRIVLGMTAKQFHIAHGIEGKKSIRPYLTQEQIDLLEVLQKVDIGLLVSVPDYHERKRHLEWYAAKIRKEC
ncbi:MAG: Rha family transcriptional regulator [Oscillospiraceae bacterium]|nr:Rha family transcriptional regulator [Oscillospiraceae bacterium]